MIFSPNIQFLSFSNKQKLDKKIKNKKIFRPTDRNVFRHVSGNTGIFFRPYTLWQQYFSLRFQSYNGGQLKPSDTVPGKA